MVSRLALEEDCLPKCDFLIGKRPVFLIIIKAKPIKSEKKMEIIDTMKGNNLESRNYAQ
jgi:hypothetical protein